MIYDAFGTLLQQTGSAENDFRYTGEQFDATSGLYYLRARHYSPHSGRFTPRDTWEGNSQDPITLHKYVYGNSDPVTHIDPSGRFSLVEMGVTQTIRTEMTSLQIDTGFSLLDRITDGQSEQFTGPLAQANQALMLGVAAIGGVQMLKMLSRKFRSACNSFDGETLVHTRQGLRPIRDIRIGDEVLAFNEATGQEEYSPVVHLIRSDKEQGWVDITTAGGEVIRATAAHPFYAKSANDPSWKWVDAANLLQGLELYTAGKEVEAVAGTRGYLAQRPAYNLTVDSTHTNFVGTKGVLAHNASSCALITEIDYNHLVNGSHGGGWHHMPGGVNQTAHTVVEYRIPRTSPDMPYAARVKLADGSEKLSSFWPDSWSQSRIEAAVKAAYAKAVSIRGNVRGNFTVDTVPEFGFRITVKTVPDGQGGLRVTTAFPELR